MHICFTVDSYFPVVCGVSHVVQNLAEGLARKEHHISVVTGNTDAGRVRSHNNVKINEFNVQGNWAIGFRGEIRAYIDFVLSLGYDVLINECAQSCSTDLLLPYLDKIKPRKILHSHGFSWLDTKARRPYLRWRQQLYYKKFSEYMKKYDHIIYLTDLIEDKAYGDRHGIANYSICGNGVEEDFFMPQDLSYARTRYGIDGPIILSLGAFCPGKGQDFVLKGFYKSKATGHALCLVGQEENAYMIRLQKVKRKLDQRYGNRDVRFFVNLPREDVVAFFQAAELFVFGSRREAFPLVIAEAMAAGTPHVSTPVGNVAYLPGGFTVKTGDEMAARIDELTEDSGERERLGREGKSYAEREFRWDCLVQKFEGVIQRVYTRAT